MTETVSPNKPLFLDIPITNISKNDKDRRVVAGYASFEVVDRQGERITHEAMKKALAKFMSNLDFANLNVMHGNCAVGKIIESYKDMNDELWETKVDDTGTFIVAELRAKGELKRADQTWQLIEEGRLKSYSLGGIALAPKERVCPTTGECHYVINDIEIHEFSIVDRPAVKGADFVIVKNESKVAPMACECGKTAETKSKFNKHESQSTHETIMTDNPQAEVIKEETVDADAEPEVAPETVEVVETEKADVTPLLMEIMGKMEKLENQYDQLLIALAPPKEAKALDYPQDKVAALTARFDEQKAVQLIELIGNDAFLLIGKDEETVEPKPEAVEEKMAPESKVTSSPDPVEEPKIDIASEIEKQVAEKVATIEAAFNDHAKVQKRTPAVPTVQEPEKILDLEKMATISIDQARELALRGAQ